MTIATAEAIEPSAPTHRLRVALIVISAIATLGAAKDVPGAFYDYGHTDPLLVFAQRVTTAKLVVSPFIAGVALLFAALIKDRAPRPCRIAGRAFAMRGPRAVRAC